MSRTSMFALGALGGLLPILVSLLTVDIAPFFDGATTLTTGNYVGYGVRVLVLVVLGGVMAALNSEVRNPMALVQLGIAAPALITSYINGASLGLPTTTDTTGIAVVSQAYASDAIAPYAVADSFFRDFTQGFGTRLDALERRNRYADRPPNSPSTLPSPPEQRPGWGAFCQTPVGKFGPSPLTPLGTPCAVPTSDGLASGIVVDQ